MEKQKYYSKDISILSSQTFEPAEKSPFLGEIVIDIATTHRDTMNDILTESFIDGAVKFLGEENKTFFLNHNVDELPIGKVLEAQKFHLPDNHKSARLRVGISKTRPDIWTLVEEGILEKGSIGFFIDEFTYDEDTDTLFIESGEVLEGSLVGLPANKNAGVVDFSKQLQYRKSLIDDRIDRDKLLKPKESKLLENTREDIEMPTQEEIDAMINKRITEALDAKKLEDDKLVLEKARKAELEALKQKEADFEKEKEAYLAALEKKELEKLELEKQLGGRQTGANPDKPKDEDKYSFDDEEKALKKSMYLLGKELVKKGDFAIDLIPSNLNDEFDVMELAN